MIFKDINDKRRKRHGYRISTVKSMLVILLVFVLVCNFTGCESMDISSVFAQEDMVESKEELRTRIEQGMEQGLEEITFKTSELDKEDFANLNAIHDGFFGNITSYSMSGFEIFDVSQVTLYCEINDNYYVERAILYGEDIPKSRKTARKLYKTCLKLIPKITKDGASLYRREKRIHDILVHNVEYGFCKGDEEETSRAYTAYGALVDKKAVCNGYAQAMKLLCDLTDVNCEMINGRAGGENHSWNLVKLGKTWYHVDATWDDPAPDDPNRILYQYFNADDQIMAQDHEWDEDAYPIAEGKDYNYFILNDLACESFGAFKKKCEEIYQEDNPSVLQIQVWDYDEDTYATRNLHFLFSLSGAWSMSVQNIGEGSRVTLYIVLKGI